MIEQYRIIGDDLRNEWALEVDLNTRQATYTKHDRPCAPGDVPEDVKDKLCEMAAEGSELSLNQINTSINGNTQPSVKKRESLIEWVKKMMDKDVSFQVQHGNNVIYIYGPVRKETGEDPNRISDGLVKSATEYLKTNHINIPTLFHVFALMPLANIELGRKLIVLQS
jgi:hypothetical protein